MADSDLNAQLMLEALQKIAGDASVPLIHLPDFEQPNGWRTIACERINIAREALDAIGSNRG